MLACRWMISLGAIVALVGNPALSAAETYRDEANHFSIDLPAGWHAMPRAQLTAINEMVRQRAPKISYSAGFRPEGAAADGYPYVLLQVNQANLANASYEELERNLGKEFNAGVKKAEGAIQDVAKNLSIGSVVLDRSRNWVLVRGQVDVNGVGRVQNLGVGHLGKDAIVFAHCYATEADFERQRLVFEQLNSDFRFDQGYGFIPGSGSSIWSKVGGGALSGALIGGIGGGVAAALFLLFFRKKPKPSGDATTPGTAP